MEWQPIETAPKGIDWLLLGYFPAYMQGKQQGGKPEIAYWNNAGHWVNCCGTPLAVAGVFSPTHWMLMPEAPNATQTPQP